MGGWVVQADREMKKEAGSQDRVRRCRVRGEACMTSPPPLGSWRPGSSHSQLCLDCGVAWWHPQVDIRDLWMAGLGVDNPPGRPVVCVGKHVCGVATDLALRAIADFSR